MAVNQFAPDLTRLPFLQACCAVAEGAAVEDDGDAPCLAAVLRDPRRRLVGFGAHPDLPRSVSSWFTGAVARYLCVSSRFWGVMAGSTSLLRVPNSIALSSDGSTVTEAYDSGLFCQPTTNLGLRYNLNNPALCLNKPRQLWVSAPDGHLFVADSGNNVVQVFAFAIKYEFAALLGSGHLDDPIGVCADGEVVVVLDARCMHVFSRHDGALVCRFGAGAAAGFHSLCFIRRDIAVSNTLDHRVHVFSRQGKPLRHVGADVLRAPTGLACSPCGELVVADTGNSLLRVFDARGRLARSFANRPFTSIALLDRSIWALDVQVAAVVWYV